MKLNIRWDFVPYWRRFNKNFNFILTLNFDVNSMLNQLYISDWVKVDTIPNNIHGACDFINEYINEPLIRIVDIR